MLFPLLNQVHNFSPQPTLPVTHSSLSTSWMSKQIFFSCNLLFASLIHRPLTLLLRQDRKNFPLTNSSNKTRALRNWVLSVSNPCQLSPRSIWRHLSPVSLSGGLWGNYRMQSISIAVLHSVLKVRRLGDTPLLPYRYNTSKCFHRQEILRLEQRTFTMAVTGVTHWSDILLRDGHQYVEKGDLILLRSPLTGHL